MALLRQRAAPIPSNTAAGNRVPAGVRPESAWIDSAYVVANLLFLFCGAWWLGQYLDSLSVDAQWSALFVLSPAALISLERLTVDLAFTSLCVGLALYVRRRREAHAYLLLVLACLCRETGFLLAGAVCLALLMERRVAQALTFATAAVPAAAWYYYVNLRTDSASPIFDQLIPFKGIIQSLMHPLDYRLAGPINAGLHGFDRMALLGFLLAALLSVWITRRNGFGPLEAAMILWSCTGLLLPRKVWEDSYSGARIFSPLLIYVMLRGWPLGGWRLMTPLLMVTPRIALEVFGNLIAAIRLP